MGLDKGKLMMVCQTRLQGTFTLTTLIAFLKIERQAIALCGE